MKICNKCKIEKPVSEYSKNRAICTSCRVAYNKVWRAKNPKKFADAKKRYYESSKGKATAIRNHKTYVLKNREKYLAHKAIWKAKNRKKNPLVVPLNCENCKIFSTKLQAHHFAGYEGENRYKVVFLCKSCHLQQHS